MPDTAAEFWQGRRDSNPRPTVLETAALPAELRPYQIRFYPDFRISVRPHPSGYVITCPIGTQLLAVALSVDPIHEGYLVWQP
jgi:hypothetical protein